jgi:hypothetical protein
MTTAWALYVMIWLQVAPTPIRPHVSYQAEHIEKMVYVNQADCEWAKGWIETEHALPDLNLIGAVPIEDCVQVPVE